MHPASMSALSIASILHKVRMASKRLRCFTSILTNVLTAELASLPARLQQSLKSLRLRKNGNNTLKSMLISLMAKRFEVRRLLSWRALCEDCQAFDRRSPTWLMKTDGNSYTAPDIVDLL